MTFALLHLLKGGNMNIKISFWISVYIGDLQSKNHASERRKAFYFRKFKMDLGE